MWSLGDREHVGKIFFIFSKMSSPALGPAHPSTQWVLYVKEADHWLGTEV